MKKIIAITFILLIGLMVLGGCASTTVEPSNNQQQNTNIEPEQNQQRIEPDQNQQQAGNNEIPQPPALPGE
jgi:uncharacterized protein YxeA